MCVKGRLVGRSNRTVLSIADWSQCRARQNAKHPIHCFAACDSPHSLQHTLESGHAFPEGAKRVGWGREGHRGRANDDPPCLWRPTTVADGPLKPAAPQLGTQNHLLDWCLLQQRLFAASQRLCHQLFLQPPEKLCRLRLLLPGAYCHVHPRLLGRGQLAQPPPGSQ